MYFYPNECYVCEATDSLKQCSGCKMISYCGEPHQKVDWKNHKTFCRAISTILRKTRQSHIFEHLKGLSRHKWMDESKNMWPEIILLLNRAFFPNEEEMLQFPRVCFVCFEARQNCLKNCPNCPFASFCPEHPSSPVHDKDCHEIKAIHDKKVLVVPSEERIQLNILVASLKRSEKQPPLSMEELMEQQFGSQTEIEENVKYYVSEAMSVPLTLYNAFQKLNQPLQSEIIVHVQGVANVHVFVQSWESILHLLPNVNSLTIVFIDSKQNSCTNVSLCNKCVLGKKKLIVEVPALPYVKYVRKKSYRKPNLLAMFMMDLYYCTRDQFRMWHENLDYWTTSSCPIVIAYKGNVERFVIENLHPYICNSSLYYMGLNSFSPLYPCLNPYDWTCCKNSRNLIIAKSPRESKAATGKDAGFVDGALLEKYQDEDDEDDPDNSIEWKKRLWRRSFYHSVCYVCQSMNPQLACKKCKMIFYCGENHRRVHWPYHKVICRAILGMLNETGATSVFDQLPMDNDKLWLKGKLDLLRKTELKIGKELVDGEREMFLFPKTCFVCHASDSSILKNCKCGISFCKIHMKDANHKEQCKDFSLSRKLMLILEPRVMHLDVKVLPKKSNRFPDTIEDFMKNCLKFNAEEFGIPNIQNILLSDYLSRTLTFLYCAEYLMDPCYFENDSLVIHVIGSTMREKYEAVFWKFILYWFNHLKNVQVIFIGPEVETKVTPAQQALLVRFDFSSIAYMRYQNLDTKFYAMKYEDYYQHEEFVQPDIIVGFNLNLHESEPEMWKQAALVLAEINCYFIMTAKSKARSYKDDNAMEELLNPDHHTPCFGNHLNPYASLIPERDYETEGLCYSNKCITFCTMFERRYRSSGKTLDELEMELKATHARIDKMLHERKKIEKEAKKKSKSDNSATKKLKLAACFQVDGKLKIPIFVDGANCARNAEMDGKCASDETLPRLDPLGEVLTEMGAKILSIGTRGKSEKSPEVKKVDRLIRKAMRRIARVEGKEERGEGERKDCGEEAEGKIVEERGAKMGGEKGEKGKIEEREGGAKEEENGKGRDEGGEKIKKEKEKEGWVKEAEKATEENGGKIKSGKVEREEGKSEGKGGKIKEGRDGGEKEKEGKIKDKGGRDEKEGKGEKIKEEEEKRKGGGEARAGKIIEEGEKEENSEGKRGEIEEERGRDGGEKEKEGKIKDKGGREEKEGKGEKIKEEEKTEGGEEVRKGKIIEEEEKEETNKGKGEKIEEERGRDGEEKEKEGKGEKIKEEEERRKGEEEARGGKIIEEEEKEEKNGGKRGEIEEERGRDGGEKEKEGKEEQEGKGEKIKEEEKTKGGEEVRKGKIIKEEEKEGKGGKIQKEKEGRGEKEEKEGKIKENKGGRGGGNKREEKGEKIKGEKEEKEENENEQENESNQKNPQSENASILIRNLKYEKKSKIKAENEIIIVKNESKKNMNLVIEKKSKIEPIFEVEIKPKTEKTDATSIESSKQSEEKRDKTHKEIEKQNSSSGNSKSAEKPKTKAKNAEETKTGKIETNDKEEEEKPKVQNIPIGSKKSKNKKQSKTEKEIPSEEANTEKENPKTSENHQIPSKKSKGKKSKTDPKEITGEVDKETENKQETSKTDNGSGKKSKNKKQSKTDKEIITAEVTGTEESKETAKKDEKVEPKKSRKQQKIDAKKALTENVKNEEKAEKSKHKKETETDTETETALLLERNKLLEEHLFLMRENEKLKMENIRLREESEKLRRGNNVNIGKQ